MINSKFEADTVRSIDSEISNDNDYQRLEKLISYSQAYKKYLSLTGITIDWKKSLLNFSKKLFKQK
tara:strand:+ start:3066 stop:3263 length:198 start_codon:yes stop_codon:yes gene_type:complete